MAPLVVEELEPESVPLFERNQDARPKIVQMMTRPTEAQRDALGELATAVGVPRSELERLAFSLVLGLGRGELVTALNQQRRDETRRRYGYGARPW